MKEQIVALRALHVMGVALCAWALSACGDDSSDDADPYVYVTARAENSACDSDYMCATGSYCLDGRCAFDCVTADDCEGTEICSGFGRCEEPGSLAGGDIAGTPSEMRAMFLAIAGRDVVEQRRPVLDEGVTPPYLFVHEEAGTIEIPISLAGDVEGPVTFRVEYIQCYASPGECNEVDRGRTIQVSGDATSVSVPYWGLKENTPLLNVRLVSNGQDFQTTLRLVTPDTSTMYVGSVELEGAVNERLPIAFELRLVGGHGNLDEAERGYVRLHTGFSAFDYVPGADSNYYTLELSRTETGWSGSAQYEVTLDENAAATMAELGPRVYAGATQESFVRRLSFQLEYQGGQLGGVISDEYFGLLERAQQAGEPERVTVAASGVLQVVPVKIERFYERVVEPRSPTPLSTLSFSNLRPQACDALASDLSVADWGGLCAVSPGDLPVDVDETACDGLISSQHFMSSSASVQRECAKYLAACALQTASPVAEFEAVRQMVQDNLANAQDELADFASDCVSATTDCEAGNCSPANRCSPSPETQCAREAIAFALSDHPTTSQAGSELRERFVLLSREQSLGALVASSALDSEMRLQWLQSEAAGERDALRTAGQEELQGWYDEVLGRRVQALEPLLDVYSLSVLTSLPNGDIPAVFDTWALESAAVWSSTLHQLADLSTQWSRLLVDEEARLARFDYHRALMADFYVAGLTLGTVFDEAGRADFRAALQGLDGFFAANNELRFTYEDRMLARGVHSLDDDLRPGGAAAPPAELTQLIDDTMVAITEAQSLTATAVSAPSGASGTITTLHEDYTDYETNLFAELTRTCGNPNECTVETYTSGTCMVPVDPLNCGLTPDSSIGETRARIEQAREQVGIAEADLKVWYQREAATHDALRFALNFREAAHLFLLLGYEPTEEVVMELMAAQERYVQSFRTRQGGVVESSTTLYEQVLLAIIVEIALAEAEGRYTSDEAYNLTLGVALELSEFRFALAYAQEVASEDTVAELASLRGSFYSANPSVYADFGVAPSLEQIDVAASAIPSGMTDITTMSRSGLVLGALSEQMNLPLASDMMFAMVAEEAALYDLEDLISRFERNFESIEPFTLAAFESVQDVERRRDGVTLQFDYLDVSLEELVRDLPRSAEERALSWLRENGYYPSYTAADFERAVNATRDSDQNTSAMIETGRMLNAARNASFALQSQYVALAKNAVIAELDTVRAQRAYLREVSELVSDLTYAAYVSDQLGLIGTLIANMDALAASPITLMRSSNMIDEAQRSLHQARHLATDAISQTEPLVLQTLVDERVNVRSARSARQLLTAVERMPRGVTTCEGQVETISYDQQTNLSLTAMRFVGDARGVHPISLAERQNDSLVLTERNLGDSAYIFSRAAEPDANDTSLSDHPREGIVALPIAFARSATVFQDDECNFQVTGVSVQVEVSGREPGGRTFPVVVVPSQSRRAHSCVAPDESIGLVTPLFEDLQGRHARYSNEQAWAVEATTSRDDEHIIRPIEGDQPLFGMYTVAFDIEDLGEGISLEDVLEVSLTLEATYERMSEEPDSCR